MRMTLIPSEGNPLHHTGTCQWDSSLKMSTLLPNVAIATTKTLTREPLENTLKTYLNCSSSLKNHRKGNKTHISVDSGDLRFDVALDRGYETVEETQIVHLGILQVLVHLIFIKNYEFIS